MYTVRDRISSFGRRATAVLLSGLLFTACSERDTGPAPVAQPPARPYNLLLICLDTVRADTWFRLAEFGDDALATWEKTALIYRNAQAPAPWTVPSIASVFTGLGPAQHGAGLFPGPIGTLRKTPPSPLLPHVRPLAERARAAGIDTGAVSASFWTNSLSTSKNLMRGFDHVTAFDTPGTEADWGPLLDAWRAEHLPRARGGRFLHYLHLMEAHNWHANFDKGMQQRYAALDAEERARTASMLPPNACGNPDSAVCRSFHVYVSGVRALRDGVADALATLQRENLLNDTVVVVFSDHGEEFFDHIGDRRSAQEKDIIKAMFKAFGHGNSLYQEQLHVPLLVWHPDRQGRTIDTPVSLNDIAPAAVRWLQLAADDVAWTGIDLRDAEAATDRTFYGAALASGEQQLSARAGTNKAIWYRVSDHVDYYDLATDPGETRSVASDALVLRFDGLFLDYEQNKPRHAVESRKLSAEQIRKLQSIGYLQGVDTGEEPESAEAPADNP